MTCLSSSSRLFQLVLIFLIPLVARAQDNSPFDKKQLKGVDTSTRRELSEEEIQQQFFKSSPGQQQSAKVFMPVFYERMERALGKIETKVTQTAHGMTVDVDATALMGMLEELVMEDWVKQKQSLFTNCVKDAVCLVPLKMFEDPQVKINFDEAALDLRIHVPPELRSPKTSSFFKGNTGRLEEATNQPAFLSSFVNINMDQSFRSDNADMDGGRDPLTAQLDSGTRIGRLVIDARGRYTEKRKEVKSKYPDFVRDDVRAIVDFEKASLRTQIGDLAYPVRGFQMFRPIGGAAFFTQYSLQPSYLTHPAGSYELFLSRPSKVTVFINDRLTQILNLPAGRHDLRDFPFSSGLNDLKLEITDDTGRTEIKDFSYFSNNTLLKPGLHELSYAVGSPWEDVAGERKYQSNNTTMSAFHRVGVSQHLTFGANVQRDSSQMVAGLDFLVSTAIGFISLEPVYTTTKDGPSGHAGRLRYIHQSYVGKERRNRFYTLEATGYSEGFDEFGNNRTGDYPVAFKLLASHSRAYSASTSINFNITNQLNRKEGNELYRSFGIGAGANIRWNKNLTTSLNFQHRRNVAGSEEVAVMGYVVWSMPEERQFVTAAHDTSSGNTRADWSYQPLQGVGGLAAQVNLQEKEESRSYGGMLDYTGNRGRVNATHQVIFPEEKTDTNQATPTEKHSYSVTNLRLGTALVFAGGHFGISRPVTDAFVMLIPQSNLSGQNVKINPQTNGSYLAQTDWLGPAVIPELPSYSYSGVIVDTKSLAAGTAVPRDNFLIRPTYHSGYAIDIGSDATVYLNTKLILADGTAAGMLAAQVINLDDSSTEPIVVFTNRDGLLRSEGFRPGRYRLEVTDGGSYQPVEFTIPRSTKGEYKMEALKLNTRSQ